jgi:hypothetical protein
MYVCYLNGASAVLASKAKKQSFAVFIGAVINNHGEDGFENDDSGQFKR